jgi:hypothetical protein vspiD_01210
MEHAKSLLPAGKQWKLVWNDEFDGTELDRSKWDFRRNLLQQEHKTLIGEEGIEVRDGCVHLKLVEKDGEFYSCQLQTGYNYLDVAGKVFYEVMDKPDAPQFRWPIDKIREPKFMHKYGYYECRCKLQKHDGWWSAFWLQSPIIGCCLDPAVAGVEVDIMECFHPDGRYVVNNHWSGYGPDHQHEGCGPGKGFRLEETPDGFHVFGVDWTPEGYTYYADGKEVLRLNKAVSRTEQFILISTECQGYRWSHHHAPELTKACLPDEFVVDYVRVYDEVK